MCGLAEGGFAFAQVAELVDAIDSKSIDGNIMRVRFSPWAQYIISNFINMKKTTLKEIGGVLRDYIFLGKPGYEMNKKFYEEHTKLYYGIYIIFILVIILLAVYFK